MEQNKPSTAEILAKIRAQKAGGATPPAAETLPPAAPPAAVPAASEPAAVAPEAPASKAAAAPSKPGSTKDILAAIRAQKGGGAATPGAAPAPTAKSTSQPAATVATSAPAKPEAAPSAPLPSVQEMLKAVREGKPVGVAAATGDVAKPKPPVVVPPLPAKPVPVAQKKGLAPSPARRKLSGVVIVSAISFGCIALGWLFGSGLLIGVGVLVWGALMTPFAAAWASITAVTGISVLGTARFMFPNVLTEPPSKFKVGPASDYPLNTVSNKWKDQFGVWIVHTDQYEGRDLIFALTSVCTHLGCTPNWLDGEQKFKCPCHGSGFYMTGVNFEGPAPRPLERAGLRVAEDGMLEVDKSVKFQEEMGQWKDPSSVVEA